MGHEMTGEVVEVGSDVEFLSEGDLVSVPSTSPAADAATAAPATPRRARP